MLTEKQHQDIQNVGLLRAAMTLLEKCGAQTNRKTRALTLAAHKAVQAALRSAWDDTDAYLNTSTQSGGAAGETSGSQS